MDDRSLGNRNRTSPFSRRQPEACSRQVLTIFWDRLKSSVFTAARRESWPSSPPSGAAVLDAAPALWVAGAAMALFAAGGATGAATDAEGRGASAGLGLG